eukprot:4576293-Lingulodinium_polyedra.AAC.1
MHQCPHVRENAVVQRAYTDARLPTLACTSTPARVRTSINTLRAVPKRDRDNARSVLIQT